MADTMGLPLTTKDLTIRSITAADWSLFQHLHTDAEVLKHVHERMDETAIKQAFEQRLQPWQPEQQHWLSLIIEHQVSGEAIGIIALRNQNLETGIIEMGFMLDLVHSGKGYGSQALACLVNYAFYNLAFHKITATCSIHNIASQKALERNGFRKEGILRHNSMVDDHYIDDCIYGLLIHDLCSINPE